MKEQILTNILVFASGMGIGVFYLWGLWWTVRKLPTTRNPGLWLVKSFVVRTAVTLLGFYVIMQGHWERLLVGLFGFLVVRILLVHRLSPVRVRASEDRSVHR